MSGSPLVPMLAETHGGLITLVYIFSVFFIIFGVFNVTIAIFVEQTVESAKSDRTRRASLRQAETVRVAKTLHKLTLKICGVQAPEREEDPWRTRMRRSVESTRSSVKAVVRRLIGSVDGEGFYRRSPEEKLIESLTAPVTRERFQAHIQDPEIGEMLDDIDVNVTNLEGLFDVLDGNGSGQIEPRELVIGLMKLRGTADKSDVVAALLGVRAVQRHLRDVHCLLIQNHRAVRTLTKDVVNMRSSVRNRDTLMAGAASQQPLGPEGSNTYRT